MILKSLYDYAQACSAKLPPEGLEWKEIEFIIVLDADGRFIRFESTRIDKKRCQRFLVAKAVKRSSGTKPNLLWDNGKYVLGLSPGDKKAHDEFIETIKALAPLHPHDKGLKALMKFYDTPPSELMVAFEADPLFPTVMEGLKSNFSFRLQSDSSLIAENRDLLAGLGMEGVEELPSGRCLVTGEYGPIVRTTTPTPLPGNSPMAALVSFQVNSGYDSYGKTQAYNAPISVKAESAISSALKYFLGKDSKNKARIGDRMILFWGTGDKEVDHKVEESLSLLIDIPDKKETDLDAKVGNVVKLFKSIYSGEIKTTLDDRFHIVGLAPNTGRIAVVFWMDSTLKEFAENISSHFEDMEIVDTRKPDKKRPYVGVYSIVSAVTQGGKVSDALPNLIDETVKSILYGTRYPAQLLSGALQRIRAELTEGPVSIQRAAILKAVINRNTKNNKQHKSLNIMLDKTNSNPGYLCGRLTAVLEKIQTDANSGDSIRTRYMGAASATPAAVFPAMLNLSLHHGEKLSDGNRIFFEQLKQEIIDKMADGGFPTHLDMADQGRFFFFNDTATTEIYTKKEK